jgi:hypothetical protein
MFPVLHFDLSLGGFHTNSCQRYQINFFYVHPFMTGYHENMQVIARNKSVGCLLKSLLLKMTQIKKYF